MSKRVTILSHHESVPAFHVETGHHGGAVFLASSAGSCSFFHQMTPDQARELAAALVVFAAEAEEALRMLGAAIAKATGSAS